MVRDNPFVGFFFGSMAGVVTRPGCRVEKGQAGHLALVVQFEPMWEEPRDDPYGKAQVIVYGGSNSAQAHVIDGPWRIVYSEWHSSQMF